MPHELSNAPQFQSHQPLLWKVIGALARSGFVATPDEARDVVHDFYVEAWEGLVRRHDVQRSAFSTYVYGAFYRFARIRIVQGRQWHQRLVSIEQAAELPADEPGPQQVLERRQALERFRHAVASLPAPHRALLADYLHESGSSERLLAARHGLTRHAVRSQLADAVARIALQLGQLPGDLPDAQRQGRVLDELWCQGRSVPRAARLLQMPEQEVRRVHAEHARQLLASLHTGHPTLKRERSDMQRDIQRLREALLHPGDEARLADLRTHAAAIRQALDGHDALLSDAEFARAAEAPDWIGRVYAALGDDAPAASETLEVVLAQLHADETAEIRDAFVTLVSTLAPALRDWSQWFSGVPEIPAAAQRHLVDECRLRSEDERLLGGLLRRGITPLAVYSSARGLQLMMNRVARAVLTPRPGRPPEPWQRAIDAPDGLRRDEFALWLGKGLAFQAMPLAALDAQIAGARHVPHAAVAPLRRWLLAVLDDRPYLVEGHVYLEDVRTFVRLPEHLTLGFQDDLTARWCRPGDRQPGASHVRPLDRAPWVHVDSTWGDLVT